MTAGFLKAAGLGSFVRGAVNKVKSFFGGGASGPITMKVKPKFPGPAARAPTQVPPKVPKMELLKGTSHSTAIPVNPPTPQSRMNTRIRSEMKRGFDG